MIGGNFDCWPLQLPNYQSFCSNCLFIQRAFGELPANVLAPNTPWHDSHPSPFDPFLIITFKSLFLDYTLMKNNLCASQKSQAEDNLRFQTISPYGNVQEWGHKIREQLRWDGTPGYHPVQCECLWSPLLRDTINTNLQEQSREMLLRTPAFAMGFLNWNVSCAVHLVADFQESQGYSVIICPYKFFC